MSNLIDPTKKTKPEPPSEALLKEIDKLNLELVDKSGQWRHVDGIGVVWQPNLPPMGDVSQLKPPAPACALTEGLFEVGKAIDFDNMPDNSVVFIRLNTDNPIRFDALQRGIIKSVLDPRFEKLKQKRICILFVQSGEDISVMSEEEMGQAGWEKKDKKRIITI